jgi:hypothetical protein
MNKFWPHLLIIAAILVGCSSDDIPSKFLEDRHHLVQAFSAFDEANEISQVPEGMTSYKPPPGAEEKVQELIRKGLKEGNSISDEFLDWLHPEMKMNFRDKLILGHKLILEGRKAEDEKDSVVKQVTGNRLIQEWYYQFWEKNVDAIYKKTYPKG